MANSYSQLAEQVQRIVHRDDLATRMPGFVQQANEMLQVRLSLELDAPSPTNPTNDLLDRQYNLYLYSTLMASYEFINELDMTDHYQKRWLEEVDYYYITSRDGLDASPVMGEAWPPAA